MAWAGFAIFFASVADQSENLIQYVNIVGSLFYGTILGIFMCAFFVKYVKGTAVFIGAIVAEACILGLYFFSDVAFLLYNIIGCLIVVIVALIIQVFQNKIARPAN